MQFKSLKPCLLSGATAVIGILLLGATSIGIANAAPQPKIDICHIAGPHGHVVEISISYNAWPAHDMHGDSEGNCDAIPDDPPTCDPTDPTTDCGEGGQD
ncbi:MAG: hypothetical protein HOM55_08895 [Proteobacteria bacterium]|jgi:hypothetical protein|nr:hypothetical protein [Pseudomonadota bacterium]